MSEQVRKQKVTKPSAPVPKTAAEVAAAEEQILEQTKRIDFYVTEYSVELLVSKMENGDFVVPAYQREYVWEASRKSRFIESVVMGLPIPFLFFWEMPNGKLEVIDGSQRLRTLHEFLLKGLRLGELEGLTRISDFAFSDLPESRRRKISNRSIRGIVLNEHADEQARFDMFDRINTGSLIADPAEVRRGVLGGAFLTVITELAQSHPFVELTPMSSSAVKKREREELVTRFFAYNDVLEGYRDRPSEYLFNFVKSMNDQVKDNPALVADLRQQFDKTMQFVSDVFPHGFVRKAGGKATPRARFESIAIGAKLALQAKPDLVAADVPDVLGWLGSEEFSKVTGSDGANAIARLRQRMTFVKTKLLNA